MVCENDKIIKENITKLHRFTSNIGFDDKLFLACKIIYIHIEKETYLYKDNPLSRLSSVIFYISERFHLDIDKTLVGPICCRYGFLNDSMPTC